MKTFKKTNIIGFKELREKAEGYIKRLEKGESFVVLRKSKPIFRLVPIDMDMESEWETIADFTKFNKHGISAKNIVERIRKLHG